MHVAALTALILTTSTADPGALTPANPDAVICPLPEGPLAGEVVLDTDCIYDSTLTLETSHTVLDCKGARLESTKGRALVVRGEIEDVLVRDCHVKGGGIRIQGPDREEGEDDDSLRARSPKDVVLEHNTVKDTSMTGTFVGAFVTGVEVRYSHYENTASSGIYLEYGSQSNHLHHNLLKANGFFTAEGLPRVDWTRREGVAVDASAYNLIEDNVFEGNAFGGVLLYKNCWEHHSTDPNQEERKQHADHNTIRNNTFLGSPFGVWVASRQARDLGAWDCGDETPYDNPIPLDEAFPPDYPMFESTIPAPYDYNIEYFIADLVGNVCLPEGEECDPWREDVWLWEDFAKDTTIEGNTFENVEMAGIRVEDDNTTITGNTFLGDFEYIYLGTPFRSRFLSHPVKDTVITGNRFEHPETYVFEEALALVPDEHEGTVLADNEPLTPPPEPDPELMPEPSPEPSPEPDMDIVSTEPSPEPAWEVIAHEVTSEDVAEVVAGEPVEPAASKKSGGCNSSGSGAGSFAAWLLLLAVAVSLRRRSATY